MSHRKTTLAVVRTGPLWRVLTENETYRTFDFRVDAEEAALKLARGLHARGQPSEILLQGRFGELRPLRTGDASR